MKRQHTLGPPENARDCPGGCGMRVEDRWTKRGTLKVIVVEGSTERHTPGRGACHLERMKRLGFGHTYDTGAWDGKRRRRKGTRQEQGDREA